MNKKLLCSIIFFLSVFSLFSQVIDYTGKGNPYKNLSQKEKDEKLLEICDKWYLKNNDNARNEMTAKFLLEAGANPNAKKDNKSLLHLAISNQNHNISRLLIDNGADAKYVSKDGESIVYLMLNENFSLDEIKYAVHKGAIITSNKIKPFLSPLSKAAASGNFELLEFCISNGCKPSDCEKDDPPPVYYALRNGDIKSVEFLLKNGDNINKKNQSLQWWIYLSSASHFNMFRFKQRICRTRRRNHYPSNRTWCKSFLRSLFRKRF